jgi:hypothetical protein
VAPGLARHRPDPAWATWEELATVAMALGSGMMIQAAIDEASVDPTLAGRVMQQLLEDAGELDLASLVAPGGRRALRQRDVARPEGFEPPTT